MKNATQLNSKWFRSTRSVVVALVAMVTMTGCPSKKDDTPVPPIATVPHAYGYGNYCSPTVYNANPGGCYGQVAGYPNMYVSALGKIGGLTGYGFTADVAVSFSTSSPYSGINGSYPGSAISVYLNVYQADPSCPVPVGQYIMTGTSNYGNPVMTFNGGTMAAGSNAQIIFSNDTFLSPGPVASNYVNASFPYKIQNDVLLTINGYNCGVFTMW